MSLHLHGADHVLTEKDLVISSSKGICLVSFVDSARLKSLQLVLRRTWGLGMPAQSPNSHSTSAFNLGVSTTMCQLRTRHTAATGDTVPVLAFYLYNRELIKVVSTACTTWEISCMWCILICHPYLTSIVILLQSCLGTSMRVGSQKKFTRRPQLFLPRCRFVGGAVSRYCYFWYTLQSHDTVDFCARR